MRKKIITKALPDSYNLALELNLQKNKRLAVFINIIPIILFIPFLLIYFLISHYFPSKAFFVNGSFDISLLPLITFFILIFASLLVHEFVHAAVMSYYSHEKPKIGFSGLYGYTGNSDFYFDKRSYLYITFAPAFFISILFLIFLPFLNGAWFLAFYLAFALHFTCCFGDFYVAYKLRKFSDSTLINDNGVSMSFYITSSE